jgi:predicted ATPase
MSAKVRFGSTAVLRDERQVLKAGSRVELGDRAFDLLLALMDQRHRVVGKHELLDAVWPGREVEENNLAAQVTALRRCLGPGVIATVHGRGYQFVAPLLEPETDITPAAKLAGRDEALQALLQCWPQQRVVSLTGPGGVGKTRLALAAVATMRTLGTHEQWPDGIKWVDLAAVESAEHIAQALRLAHALPAGQESQAQPPSVTDLAERLHGARMLLVLDNAEHLQTDVTALVQALMHKAPGVHVLVTSRQALGVIDEHILPLQGLDPEAAVQMFAECVRLAVGPHPVPPMAPGDAQAVCSALDGLPLAIELAAARLPLLGLRSLRETLDQRLHALSDDRQDARHRSLQDVLSWSYGLLPPAEQAMLRALSVLLGPFDLNLALAVAGMAHAPGGGKAPMAEHWAGVREFEALVRKSLVTPDPDRPHVWRLLHTTRLFALKALQQQGEEPAVRERHALALLTLYQALDDAWLAGHGSERQIDSQGLASLDNLVSAIDWACGAGARPDLAAELLAASGRVLRVHGLRHVAQARIQAVLPRLLGAPAERHAFWVGLSAIATLDAEYNALLQRRLLNAAKALAAQGDAARALVASTRAAHLSLRLSDLVGRAEALALGQSVHHAGLPGRLRALWLYACEFAYLHDGAGEPVTDATLAELVEDLQAEDDSSCRAGLLLRIVRAEHLLLQGRWEAARAPLQAVCDEVHLSGLSPDVTALAPYDALAMAELGCGDVAAAAVLLRRSFASARWLDSWLELAGPVAWCLVAQGRHRASGLLLGAARRHESQVSQHTQPCTQFAMQQAQQVLSTVADSATLSRWHAEGHDLGGAGLKALLDGDDPRFMP